MANNEKTTIYYRVVVGPNPNNKDEIIKRPVITRRETYSLSRVVKAAIDSGRIRGKYHDLTGVINGFMDQIKVLLEEGKSINADFMRLHAELTNQLGDSETITSANGLKTCVTPLSELKLDVDKFSWQRIDDNGIKLSLSTIKGEGLKLGQVMPGKKATINGRNLVILEGDSVTAKCAELTKECEVLESDEDHLVIIVPVDFDLPELEKKDLVFTVKSRCGDEEGAYQSKPIRATIIADKTPKLVSMIGEKSGKANVSKSWEDTMTITLKNASTEGAKVRRTLYDEDGTMVAETYWEMGGCTLEVVSDTVMKFTCRENRTREPFDNWATKYRAETEVKLADGTILSTPLTFEYED